MSWIFNWNILVFYLCQQVALLISINGHEKTLTCREKLSIRAGRIISILIFILILAWNASCEAFSFTTMLWLYRVLWIQCPSRFLYNGAKEPKLSQAVACLAQLAMVRFAKQTKKQTKKQPLLGFACTSLRAVTVNGVWSSQQGWTVIFQQFCFTFYTPSQKTHYNTHHRIKTKCITCYARYHYCKTITLTSLFWAKLHFPPLKGQL